MAVNRDSRSTIGRPQRVEDVVVVVGREVGVERHVEYPLLHAGRPDVGELQEQGRVRGGVRGRQDLDLARQLRHQHAAFGQELDAS